MAATSASPMAPLVVSFGWQDGTGRSVFGCLILNAAVETDTVSTFECLIDSSVSRKLKKPFKAPPTNSSNWRKSKDRAT
jgi:hypothetical protein